MDIWIARCNKSVKCSSCGDMIEKGEPCIFGLLWKKPNAESGKSEARRWRLRFHWHVKRKKDGVCCWLEYGLARMEREPFVETRGRKRLVLPKDLREARRLVMLRRGRVVQRLKQEMEAEQPDYDKIIKLGEQLEKLKQEIAGLGGVPNTWE